MLGSCITLVRAGDLGLWLLEGPSANELWYAHFVCAQIAIVAKQLIARRLSSFPAGTALLGPLDPADILWVCLFTCF